MALLTPERRTTFSGIPWWAFYVAGAVAVVLLPVIPWKRWRRGCLVLGVFPAIKACGLALRLSGSTGGVLAYRAVFLVVAGLAAVLLWRAALRDEGRM